MRRIQCEEGITFRDKIQNNRIKKLFLLFLPIKMMFMILLLNDQLYLFQWFCATLTTLIRM